MGKPGSAAFENAVKTAKKRINLKGLLPTPLGLAGVARLRRKSDSPAALVLTFARFLAKTFMAFARNRAYVPPGALEKLTIARSAELESNHVKWVCQIDQTGTQRVPYGDQSYITDGNAVRVRVWGKADEYLCNCTSLSLSREAEIGESCSGSCVSLLL